MKLKERVLGDANELIIEETHDPNPTLDSVQNLKSAGKVGFSEHKHVGRVPFFLIEMWVKEAGISFTDQDAVKELVHQKLLSGEFNALRPWEGTYNWK